MSDAVDRQEGGAALRVLFCFGALQPFFDLEIDEFPAVMNAIVGAFDDLEGRFGVHVIGTMDDDELVSGPTDTYPWTAYVLADAPSLDAVKRVCAVLRETQVGKHAVGRYMRLEARVGRPLFFATT
jgi:hypothetical protein